MYATQRAVRKTGEGEERSCALARYCGFLRMLAREELLCDVNGLPDGQGTCLQRHTCAGEQQDSPEILHCCRDEVSFRIGRIFLTAGRTPESGGKWAYSEVLQLTAILSCT